MAIKKTIERFPATAIERMMNMARHLHDGQGRCVLSFSGRLDEERLERALRLGVVNAPILGCRFVAHPFRSYWEQVPDLERVPLLSIMETEDENLIDQFLGAHFDPCACVQFRARLFRGQNDKLAMKISHETVDAGGLLEFLGLVFELYRRLRKNPVYLPNPGNERRGQKAVLRNAGWRKVLRGCHHFSCPRPQFSFPVPIGMPGKPTFALRSSEPEFYRRLREYCLKHRISVGELLLAAFCRSLFKISAPFSTAPLAIQCTKNLRSHLPADIMQRVCNLTGVFFPEFRNRSLPDLVENVHKAMASARHDNPWIGGACLLELIFLLPEGLVRMPLKRSMLRQISSGRVYPFFANLGVIDTARLDFRDSELLEISLFGPVPHCPGSIITLYTVNERLTVTTGAWSGSSAMGAEGLLEAFFNELPG